MPIPLRLALATAGARTLYFAVSAVLSALTRKQATTVALAEALIEEQNRATRSVPLRERLSHAAAARGWTGMLTPIVLASTFMWATITIAGTLLLGNRLASMIVAAPVTAGIVWMIGGSMANKRKTAFDRQFLGMLTLVADQLRAGTPIRGALQQVTLVTEEPLRGELRGALDEAAATKDLIGALRSLSTRYPSRAFDLFLTALEIDRDAGGKIEPALREAAADLTKDFELAQEANAEIAQARIEYYGILVIMGFIAGMMVFAVDDDARVAYTRIWALVLLGVGTGWFAVGVLFTQKLFRQANGDRPRKLDKRTKEPRFRRRSNPNEVTS